MSAAAASRGTPLKCSNQTLEEQLAILRLFHQRETEANEAFAKAHPELVQSKAKRVKGKEAAALAAEKQEKETPPAPQISLLERLKQFNLEPFQDELATEDLEARRPKGHSTHNLLVKDKRSKKIILVTHRQHARANLKVVAKTVPGCREVRLAGPKDVQASLGEAAGGCISVFSLWYNKDRNVAVVLDDQLKNGAADSKLRICVGKTAGCEDPADHKQHKVVEITIQDFNTLLQEMGHEVHDLEFEDDPNLVQK